MFLSEGQSRFLSCDHFVFILERQWTFLSVWDKTSKHSHRDPREQQVSDSCSHHQEVTPPHHHPQTEHEHTAPSFPETNQRKPGVSLWLYAAHWATSEGRYRAENIGLTCTVHLPQTSISSEACISERRTSNRGAAGDLRRATVSGGSHGSGRKFCRLFSV